MNTPNTQFSAKLWQRTTFWRSGAGLAIITVAFVGLRLLWIQIQRPAHLAENAAAYGGIRNFYGPAQMNRDGSQLTYVAPANDRGHAVFLADAATGKKRQIMEDTNGLRVGNAEFDIQAGPWSPDDSAFVCLVDQQMVICDAPTGRSLGNFTLPTVPGAVTWLNPAKVMCVTAGKLYELNRQANGTWTSKETALGNLERRSRLDAISVSAGQSAPGEGADNAMDGDDVTTWYSGKTADPVWLQCQFSGLTWAITHYKLASSPGDDSTAPRDWQLLGSNDATNWVVLDTRSNETFTAGEPAKEYDFANETPYWFYRLNVTATAGGSGVRLAQLQLYSRATPTIASASSSTKNPGESAAVAFDGSVNTKWFNNYENTPAWLRYQIGGGTGVALSEYSLTSGEDVPSRDPGDWEFQASNDGVTWTTLDTRSGESFDSRLQTKSYSFKNVTPYRIYRLYITQNHGLDQFGFGGVQLAELDLELKELLARIGNPDGGLAQRNLGTNVVATASDARMRSPRALRPDELTHWFSGSAKGPVWRQSEFKDGAWVIRQYKLISSPAVPATDPRDWQLLASNDGVHWATLDSQSNQVFSTRGRVKRYPLPNQTAYRFYRLNLTANAAGNDNGVHLGEFQLWSDDTPAMASASAENAPREGVIQAFDGDPNTKWYNANAGASGWLQYQFGGGLAPVLSRYALTSGNDVPARDPKNWQFQASNDGRTWTTLNERENQTFESRLQTKTYAFFNDQPYRFYRLNILTNGGDASLQLSELAIGEAQSVGPPSSPNPGAADDARKGSAGSNDNPFYNAISLTALDSKTIAWGQPDCIWSLNVGAENPRLLVDLRSALPPNTKLLRFSYARRTGQYLLNCDTGGALSLWRFDPNHPSDLAKIADNASDGYWIDTGAAPGEFVYANRAANPPQLMRADLSGKLTQLLAPGNYDWFQVTPDQKQVFVLGGLSNQPVAGIWRYDVASAAWHPVISSSDCPSPHAQGVVTLQQNMNLPGGNVPVTIYRPANFNPHKKYPLLIGDTQLNTEPFLKSVAACGACVAVVGRPYWAGGIEHWVENVQGLYEQMKHDPTVDTSRVYLFAVSAETYYLSQMVATNSAPWRGLLLLTPGALPDFSRLSPFQLRPKILLDTGGEEHQEDRFKQYQANALKSGVMVEYYTHPGETHFMVGADWTRKRVMEEKHFIFEE
jgi:hypothetical protein